MSWLIEISLQWLDLPLWISCKGLLIHWNGNPLYIGLKGIRSEFLWIYSRLYICKDLPLCPALYWNKVTQPSHRLLECIFWRVPNNLLLEPEIASREINDNPLNQISSLICKYRTDTHLKKKLIHVDCNLLVLTLNTSEMLNFSISNELFIFSLIYAFILK